MQTSPTEHSADTRRTVPEPQQFPPLAHEQRTHVDTNAASFYLNRRPQTLRDWNCHVAFPAAGLRPLVVNGRLAWPVCAIKALMGVSS